MSVWASVCPPQAGIKSKRLDGSSWISSDRLIATYPILCCKEMIPSKTRILPPRERKKISQRKLFVGICCQFIVRQKWTLHVIKQTIVVGRIKLTLLATVDVSSSLWHDMRMMQSSCAFVALANLRYINVLNNNNNASRRTGPSVITGEQSVTGVSRYRACCGSISRDNKYRYHERPANWSGVNTGRPCTSDVRCWRTLVYCFRVAARCFCLRSIHRWPQSCLCYRDLCLSEAVRSSASLALFRKSLNWNCLRAILYRLTNS